MRKVREFLRSLTCKMMAFTVAIGLVTWGVVDYVQGRHLKAIFDRQISGELEIQGKDARVHFDEYVAKYQKAARIFVSQTRFSDYLAGRRFGAIRKPRVYSEIPPWLPGASVMRALVRVRYAILLNGKGEVKEIYQEDSGALPPRLLHPGNLLRQLSFNQSLMTDINGAPFVVTATPFLGRKGQVKAVLMLASPIDDDFLMSSQPSNGMLTAITDPGKQVVIASNRPDTLPGGSPLSSIRQNYHVTGKSFFDVGSSDLLLNFISLIPDAEYNKLSRAVVSTGRQQRAIVALILILAFALSTFWITRRIGRLTEHVMDFSERVLHRKPGGPARGDEIDVLEKQFRRLTEEITTYQNVILRNYHFQSSISSILRISLASVSFEEKWERITDSVLAMPFLSGKPLGCRLYLAGEAPGVLALEIQRGLPQPIPASCREIRLTDESIYTPSIIGQRPVFAGPFEQRHTDMCCQEMQPHGHYFVPMVSAGKLLGLLDLFLEELHERDHEEEAMLSSIAGTLAQIIERDNAEREKQGLLRQLSQAEKLSALGRLTANVAHEIRNPLTSIGGFARRLGKKLSPGSDENDFARIITSETDHLERILRGVLSYSRDARLLLESKDMNALIEESLKTFGDMINEKDIKVERKFEDVAPVMVDGFQVKEALNNFILNAVQAMPGGGTLNVATRKAVLREAAYLIVEIADTGGGIPEDKAAMVFEPFFTTKQLGRGTGLGLPISKKIVEDHGGFICFDTSPEKGTTFRLHFPYGGLSSDGGKEREIAGIRCSLNVPRSGA